MLGLKKMPFDCYIIVVLSFSHFLLVKVDVSQDITVVNIQMVWRNILNIKFPLDLFCSNFTKIGSGSNGNTTWISGVKECGI